MLNRLSSSAQSRNRFNSPVCVGRPTVPSYGRHRSRDHRSATALHHVFTTVYDARGVSIDVGEQSERVMGVNRSSDDALLLIAPKNHRDSVKPRMMLLLFS